MIGRQLRVVRRAAGFRRLAEAKISHVEAILRLRSLPMPFERRFRRRAVLTSLGVVLGGTAAASAFAAANPSIAAAAIAMVQSVACSTTGASPCISGANTSSGIGVIGTSKTGTGLRGTSTSQYGLKSTSTSNYAILAQTTSGAAAISASNAAAGDGVFGASTAAAGGIGVFGQSVNGFGVYGSTTTGAGYGIMGYETGSGTGAYGYGASGTGVDALSSSGTGLFAQTFGSGQAIVAQASAGRAISATNASNSGDSPAMFVRNSAGNGADVGGAYIGLVGRAPVGGFPLVATDPGGNNNLFYVDGAGDIVYRGGLFHVAAVKGGALVKSFTASSALPTVEDTGTAQLVGGVAAVRLDPTFAASIDMTSAYRVFVTPNGDTHGLFVATKTPAGFVVHEAQGGRSTVTFDYRIVATAAGQGNVRMAVVNPAAGAAVPAAALPTSAAAANVTVPLVKPATAPPVQPDSP
jgi:hypothetical protein